MRGALAAILMLVATPAAAQNPIVESGYADPEIRIFGSEYGLYPTVSAPSHQPDLATVFIPSQQAWRARSDIWAPFLAQTRLDAFSSPDLVNWTRHLRVLSVEDVSWAA